MEETSLACVSLKEDLVTSAGDETRRCREEAEFSKGKEGDLTKGG